MTMRVFLTWFIAVGAGVLTLITGVAWLLPLWWVGELLGHTRLHVGMGLVVCAIVLVSMRHWWAIVFLLTGLLNLSLLGPFYTTRNAPDDRVARDLKVLHYNLDMTANDHRVAFNYLRSQQADILLLQEVTPQLARKFANELPDYQVVYARPLPNTHGSALLLPLDTPLTVQAAGEIFLPASSPRPMITATLTFNGQPLSLLSMSAVRPKDDYTHNIQEQEYAAIGAWVAEQRLQTGYPMLVIGDFNNTPWSARFQRLLTTSGLRNSSNGFGYQPTWPAFLPAPLAIPIDHCLVSPNLAIIAYGVGPDLGGDHTALWLQFQLLTT
jgi:endonuclease/exonuclease/phosphatase (EEP) superfamily protein YafD